MITDPNTENVRAENAELKKSLAEMQARMAALEEGAVAARAPVDTGPRPQYKLIKPFYGPNDRYYDPEEGEEVIEWTGVPNDCMEPLNEPAIQRMRKWQESLPGGGNLPIEFILEAAMNLRPQHGEDDTPLADFAADVMRSAIKKRNAAEGRPVEHFEISMPHKHENVPVTGGGKNAVYRGKEIIEAVPQAPKPKGRPKRVFGTGAGVDERPIEIG